MLKRHAPAARSGWTILCDFDGTIANDDVIDALLVRYGVPGWQRLEDEWRKGLIGSRECMQGQVALLDMSQAELDSHLAGCEIDPEFPAFVAMTRELGAPLRVVSDGLDYAIHKILGRHGLDGLPKAANHMRPVGLRAWQLSSPLRGDGCGSGTCKCACAAQAHQAGNRTLLIGDGGSDFCVAEQVDFVFAKSRLIDHCRDNDIAYRPITNFGDALALLPQLLDGDLADTAWPELAVASL